MDRADLRYLGVSFSVPGSKALVDSSINSIGFFLINARAMPIRDAGLPKSSIRFHPLVYLILPVIHSLAT